MGQPFPHPDLTPQQCEALTILMEECSELAKECSKILRMGPDFCPKGGETPSRTFLTEETIDVLMFTLIVQDLGLMDEDFDGDAYAAAKVERMERWTNLSEIAKKVMMV